MRELNAVCFVIQSTITRLTPSQIYVFNEVLKIFGVDIKENICVCYTFYDGGKLNSREAVKAVGVDPKKD